MKFYQEHRKSMIIISIVLALIIFVVAQYLYIRFNGTPVPAPDIPRQSITIGNGPELRYAILGDSTTVGQGGDYQTGIAVQSAEHLARNHTVTYQNFGVSGAQMTDVLNSQLDAAITFKPDVVLISAAANDVTHLTSAKSAKNDLQAILDGLKDSNPDVRIVYTGSPQVGTAPRFPQPVRYFARLRTNYLNDQLLKVGSQENIVIAPIAEKTGPIFSKNPRLFAPDNFHPNTEGYQVWTPVINAAIDELNISQ